MMRVEVITPEDYMGDVIGDLIVEEVKFLLQIKEETPPL